MAFIPGLDRKDAFVTGHGTLGGPTLRMEKMPEWMKDEKNVRGLLLQVFPKLENNKRQRKSAARWAAIIRFYFKMALSARDVAKELNTTEKKIYDTAQRITRAGAGLRTTGKKRTGKPGRPKTKYF